MLFFLFRAFKFARLGEGMAGVGARAPRGHVCELAACNAMWFLQNDPLPPFMEKFSGDLFINRSVHQRSVHSRSLHTLL
jgi:hypothetical protein